MERDWSLKDFYGSYHRSRIISNIAVPGTQLKFEDAEIKKREEARKKRDDDLITFAKEHRHKAVRRGRSLEISGQANLRATLGSNLLGVRKTLMEAERDGMEVGRERSKDKEFKTFFESVEKGRLAWLRRQLEDGFDMINDTKNLKTALAVAVSLGREEVVEILLEFGADPNQSCDIG